MFDSITLFEVTQYPEDKMAIAKLDYNGHVFNVHLKEVNKEWLLTDIWWPMHRPITQLEPEALKMCWLFGADRFDFKLVGIKRYLCLGFARFAVADQNVAGIFN